MRYHGRVLFADVIVLLAVATAGLVAGRALGLPSIVAYLVAGVLVGPGGLGLVSHSAAIGELAELGVALLFGVGIEFSLERLRRILPRMLASGALQVAGTVAATALAFRALALPWPAALFTGFLVSLSSTAIVFKLYDEEGELDAPQGLAAAGILLFQDLAMVPMMLPRAGAGERGRGCGEGGPRGAPRGHDRARRGPRAGARRAAAGPRARGARPHAGALPAGRPRRRLRHRARRRATRALAADRRLPRGPRALGKPLRAPGLRRAAPAPRRVRRDLLHLDRDALRARGDRARARAAGRHGRRRAVQGRAHRGDRGAPLALGAARDPDRFRPRADR